VGRFEVNRADPPLDFPDDTFDLVYSYSVLTHLSAERQKPWVAELRRVLKPGGYLLVTVHGMSNAIRDELPSEDLGRMERGELVVVAAEKSGTNACAAYHSERYVRTELVQGLTLVDFLPRGMFDATEQDIYLFRK
jgi:SAM-dependent methyltransferase